MDCTLFTREAKGVQFLYFLVTFKKIQELHLVIKKYHRLKWRLQDGCGGHSQGNRKMKGGTRQVNVVFSRTKGIVSMSCANYGKL